MFIVAFFVYNVNNKSPQRGLLFFLNKELFFGFRYQYNTVPNTGYCNFSTGF